MPRVCKSLSWHDAYILSVYPMRIWCDMTNNGASENATFHFILQPTISLGFYAIYIISFCNEWLWLYHYVSIWTQIKQ